MSRIRRYWQALIGLGLVGSFASLAGAAPWEQLLTLNPVEADPKKDYAVTEDNGPWMILAASFSGEGAERQARELVLEIRKKYKLPAYLYMKSFDYSGETQGRGVDQFGDPRKMRYARGEDVQEIAVLVGDYQAIDDPDAQATLEKLKYQCHPDCLKIDKSKKTTMNLAGLRLIQKTLLKDGNEKKKKGPLGHAFLTTNPLLPQEYFAPKGLDPLVIKSNEGVEHCLLDCPGKYTVQVAHFTGKTVMDQAKVQAIESGKLEIKSSLADAADKAHRLTVALRMKGYEAYEFHDRYASVVTVGSFDSMGTPRPDGKTEINPQIQRIIETFRAKQESLQGKSAGAMVPKTVVGIPLDIQPIPVQVPKRSLSAAYARDAIVEPSRR
jgi:hypothetical protein